MRIRFDAFEVDTTNARLLKFGVRVHLREQALQVLLALLERPGETVTRSELRERLWSDSTTVDFEAGLNTAVSRLRTVLNDESESPRFIETVPKRGYRFIAPVPVQPSVAVLPLRNASDDQEGEYIADGLTEDLIRIICRIEGMRVVSRSAVWRFRGKQYEPTQVAKELGVTHLVEGSIRRAAERIRIHIHLVNGRDGFELWSERFDGEWSEILLIQDQVAEALAAVLKGRLLPDNPRVRPANAGAYAAYIKGHYLVARHALTRALEYFDEAIRLDSKYALAYHGAAVGYVLRALMGQSRPAEAMDTAENFLRRGLEIAPDLSMMQNTLGMLRMFQWRWHEAQAAYERAISVAPENAYAHMMFAIHHSFRNQHARALQSARRALALEPLDAMTNFRMVQCSYYARDYDAAITAARTAIELAPGLASAYCYLGWALLEEGSDEEAWTMASKARDLERESPILQGQAGYVAGRTGRMSEAERILEHLHHQRAAAYCPAISIAWVQLGMGDAQAALKWLQVALDEREPYLASAAVFPAYDPLRSDLQFKSLLQRVESTGGC